MKRLAALLVLLVGCKRHHRDLELPVRLTLEGSGDCLLQFKPCEQEDEDAKMKACAGGVFSGKVVTDRDVANPVIEIEVQDDQGVIVDVATDTIDELHTDETWTFEAKTDTDFAVFVVRRLEGLPTK